MFCINNIKKESVVLGLIISCFPTAIYSSHESGPIQHRHTKSQEIRSALFETDGFNERFQKTFINNDGKAPQRHAVHMMDEDLIVLEKLIHKKKHMLHAKKRQMTACMRAESPFARYGNCHEGIEELRVLKAQKKTLAKQYEFVHTLRDAVTEKAAAAELIKNVSQNNGPIKEIPATVEKIYQFGRTIQQVYGEDDFKANADHIFARRTMHAMKQDIEGSIERIMPLLKKQ